MPFFDLLVDSWSCPLNQAAPWLEIAEARHFGAEVVAPGLAASRDREFIEWASHYNNGTREGRSLGRHQAWLETLSCPVMRPRRHTNGNRSGG